MKWPSLISKNRKELFYKEKSLVGLTPSLNLTDGKGVNNANRFKVFYQILKNSKQTNNSFRNNIQ
jgi:hypothetical protein